MFILRSTPNHSPLKHKCLVKTRHQINHIIHLSLISVQTSLRRHHQVNFFRPVWYECILIFNKTKTLRSLAIISFCMEMNCSTWVLKCRHKVDCCGFFWWETNRRLYYNWSKYVTFCVLVLLMACTMQLRSARCAKNLHFDHVFIVTMIKVGFPFVRISIAIEMGSFYTPKYVLFEFYI